MIFFVAQIEVLSTIELQLTEYRIIFNRKFKLVAGDTTRFDTSKPLLDEFTFVCLENITLFYSIIKITRFYSFPEYVLILPVNVGSTPHK